MIKKTDKIRELPLFSKGCLTFKDSNHTLVKNGEYYRCSLKANGFCIKKSEQLIDAKKMEDRLSRLLEKFLLPSETATPLFKKLISLFVKVIF
jgi:hypothetical protein